MQLSWLFSTGNAFVQFMILMVYFLMNVSTHVNSVSWHIHHSPPFMILLSITIIIENFILLIHALNEEEEVERMYGSKKYTNIFQVVLTASALNLIGWIMLVTYDYDPLHYTGTIMFNIGLFIMYMVLVYRFGLLFSYIGVMYAVTLGFIVTFTVMYVTGTSNLSYYFEWSGFVLFSLTNTLFYSKITDS